MLLSHMQTIICLISLCSVEILCFSSWSQPPPSVIGQGIIGQAAETGEAINCRDVNFDERYSPETDKVFFLLSVFHIFRGNEKEKEKR